ncbi:MAG: hypothetical protein IH787_07260 [Nitrospirae bacterium]|nr:hypothetical protein [Nitrospirota bacterium]
MEGKFQSRALALLQADPTISEAERAAVLPLGPDVWAEASRRVESHFDIEPAIPDRDLAVYSPSEVDADDRLRQESLDQIDEIARLALAAGAVEVEAVEEAAEDLLLEPELDLAQDLDRAAAEALAADELASTTVSEEVIPPQGDIELVKWDLAAAMDPSRLTPLPLVAAALEAVGLDEEKFGFLLRYGVLAPSGRTSEIKIAGLGMAEFSDRAAQWFEALGASKFPIQVIDDGSGELTVYLLESVPA